MTSCEFDEKRATKLKVVQGEKRETSTKTCNETMLRDKLRVFVSRISPPLIKLICHAKKNN